MYISSPTEIIIVGSTTRSCYSSPTNTNINNIMLLHSESIYISDKSSKISETTATKASQMQVSLDFQIQVSQHPMVH